MNDRQISYLEDAEVVALPEVARLLKVKRRNMPMRFADVKTLTEALQPGMARSANLERYGNAWRLRFTLRLDGGIRTRRSILIYDILTMKWVRDYIAWARSKRREYKSELGSRWLKKRWEENGEQFIKSMKAAHGVNEQTAHLQDCADAVHDYQAIMAW